MKLFLQIVPFFFTWFNLSATPAFEKTALPSYAVSLPKTTNQNQESELKIGVSNFARSGILENSFSQKAVLWESYVLENRAHGGNDRLVQGAGSLVPSSLITKITQSGATKLKAWTSGKSLNFVDDAGNVLTGANAEAKIFEKLESSIGSKTVLETTTDANGRLLVQTERGTNSNPPLLVLREGSSGQIHQQTN